MDSIDQDSNLFSELLTANQAGEPVALATIIRARGSVPRHVGSKMLIYGDGRANGTIGGGEMESRVISEAIEALEEREARIVPYSLVDPEKGDPGVCGGEVEIYIEPYQPQATVLVIGCGHVGRATVHLAGWLGFRVVVNDDRAELVDPETTPGGDLYIPGTVDDLLSGFRVTGNTYVVNVTRNVLLDRETLPRLVDTPAPYIGVIGSRRRWEETKRLLSQDGLTGEQLERLHSPIGLELHAETPEEIALSIMAEIIMFRRGGTGDRMAESHQIRAGSAQ
jgi:xanthine dehydrogenase accessory factor